MSQFPPKSILFPTDLSESSLAPAPYVRLLGERFGSRVVALHAEHFETPPYFTSAQLEPLLRELREVRKEASRKVGETVSSRLGFMPETAVREGYPPDVILDFGSQRGFDLIAMGTHGRRGVRRLWMGSVTERVLRLARRPVLSVRTEISALLIERIFCPVGSGGAGPPALDYAVSVARAFEAELTVMHVAEQETPPLSCPGVDDALRRRCRIEEVVARGNPVEQILARIEDHGADLVVMGSERKPAGLEELFSTTTEQVMRRARAPLVVVPK